MAVLLDRWGLAVLFGGECPRSRTESLTADKFLVGEREYLRFLTAVQRSDRRPAILRVLDDVERVIRRSKHPDGTKLVVSTEACLLSLDQVAELHRRSVTLSRLDVDTIGLLPTVASQWGLTHTEAETLLLASSLEVPLFTCFRTLRPPMWKALFMYSVNKHDVEHTCPDVSVPPSWYRFSK